MKGSSGDLIVRNLQTKGQASQPILCGTVENVQETQQSLRYRCKCEQSHDEVLYKALQRRNPWTADKWKHKKNQDQRGQRVVCMREQRGAGVGKCSKSHADG